MSLSTKSQLRFAKLTENAFPPMKGSAYAAGWDLQRYIHVKKIFFEILIISIYLYSAYDYIIPARGRIIAQTDIQIAVPVGCYGRVGKNNYYLFERELIASFFLAPRSGLAAKFGIDTGGNIRIKSISLINDIFSCKIAGVIDADYRGNVGVILFNHNDSEFISKLNDFLFYNYFFI